MKTTRTKTKTLPVIHTRAEAEALVAQYASVKAAEAKNIAARDQRVLEAQEAYTEILSYLSDQAATAVKILAAWAQAHPEEFPKDRKSIQFAAGTIGFRTGNPKLEPRSKWTWEKILARIQELKLVAWIRNKPEVDREAILAQHAAGKLLDGDLTTIGVRITQDESFYVDPAVTAPRQTIAA